ncbi:hypothetical protein MSPP1_001610 [Malassezia sp. CBS 17886]|nr:hypothetical protein MSPP1_001610 [Malassezia sp. CBS 17886]
MILRLAGLLLAVACAGATPLDARANNIPLPPTVDPFYVPPAGWETAEPGTILASRSIQAGFTTTQKMNLQSAYQLLYRTSGTAPTEPMYTVTTILVPHNAHTNKLVLALPYEDSNYVMCSPSYKIQLNAAISVNAVQTLEELLWTSVLNDGWIMTIPDHEGPLSAFSSGFLEGHASLDAARATLKFDELKMDPKAPIVGTGYSGGAIAGGWAASLHDTYAPELNMAGWALGGTPSNLNATFYSLDGGLFSGFVAAGLAGVVDSYPVAQEYVGGVITEQGNVALQYTRENCMAEIIVGLQGVNLLNQTIVKNSAEFLKAKVIQGLLHTLSMGSNATLTPKAPVYMYHAVHDEVIAYGMANETARQWCNNGANVEFQSFTGLEMGHISTEALNTPFVLAFIRDRMAGKSFQAGCKWTWAVDPLWQPSILGARLTEVLNAVMNLFGAEIGKGDQTFKESISQNTFGSKKKGQA